MRRRLRPSLPASLGAVLGLVAGLAWGQQEQCGVCHPQQRVLAADSIHSSEGVGCTSCHGGDESSDSVEGAHRGNYRALKDRAAIPAACARCHADSEMMRPYDLPVDQYAIYQTSQHGRAVARGNERAAVCVDCHGVHDIRSPADPRSPTNARNVPATCGRCHGDRSLMERFGHDAGVVDDYLQSVHGKAVADGNLAAPTCIGCHGVHGAAPPGVGDIDKVCGSCHTRTRRAFIEGPHRAAMLAAGLPECASCHSDHAIETFDVSQIATVCVGCHEKDSDEAGVGRQIQALVADAVAEVDRAEAVTLAAEQLPLDVEDYLARLVEARTQITEALSLVHTVSVDPVQEVARRASSIGEEVQSELDAKMDRTNAHVGLAIFWFYLTMTLIILFVYKRRLRRQREGR
jgi:hypothetical protein